MQSSHQVFITGLDVTCMYGLNPKADWKAVKHFRGVSRPSLPLVLCLVLVGRLVCPWDLTSYDGGRLCSWQVQWGQIAQREKSQTKQHPGRSNEQINCCPQWSHQFIWSAMIQVISDHFPHPDHLKETHWTGHQVNNHTVCTSLNTVDKENLLLQDNKII